MLIIKENNVLIKFNKKFYTKDSIETSKKNYVKICKTAIQEKKNYFLVRLYPINTNLKLEKLGLEFSNYVLSSQKE